MGLESEDYPIIVNTGVITYCNSIKSISEAIQFCFQTRCDKLICPIFTNDYLISLAKKNQKNLIDLDLCLIPSDSFYKKNQYYLFNPEINECVWDDNFPQYLREEILVAISGYCSFLNLKNFVIKIALDGTQNQHDDKLTDVVLETIKNVKKQMRKSFSKLIILFSLDGSSQGDGNTGKNDSIWNRYIRFRSKFDNIMQNYEFGLGLQFKGNLPSPRIVNRWKSEKVSFITFNTESFIENSKGYATLPKKHERIFHQFINLRAGVLLKLQKISDKQEQYFKYLDYSYRTMTKNILKSDKDAINLLDYLQDPLQPYADNLQSITYEIFENDTIKYDEYQGALEQALQKFPKQSKVIIYYIGAGRGGLIYSAFAAAKKKQRKIHIYAIEKNPFPIQTIKQRIKNNKWSEYITLIQSDIRDYKMQEKPDIFLSQLLGGFGDNELSPECLFWAEKHIHQNTICIPSSYTAYIKPISYQGIHRGLSKSDRNCYYTVNFGSCYTNFLSQKVWEFRHPLKQGEKQFNKDSEPIEFEAKEDIVINGVAGYFTSNLFQTVQLSILPERPMIGSYSWFPLFFPFESTVFMNKGDKIAIKMRRRHLDKKVWYQWQYLFNGEASPFHNQNGWKIIIEL